MKKPEKRIPRERIEKEYPHLKGVEDPRGVRGPDQYFRHYKREEQHEPPLSEPEVDDEDNEVDEDGLAVTILEEDGEETEASLIPAGEHLDLTLFDPIDGKVTGVIRCQEVVKGFAIPIPQPESHLPPIHLKDSISARLRRGKWVLLHEFKSPATDESPSLQIGKSVVASLNDSRIGYTPDPLSGRLGHDPEPAPAKQEQIDEEGQFPRGA